MSPLARRLRPNRFRPLAGECLERRCLLAGIVTATLSDAGELQLFGNAKNNAVEVRSLGLDLLVRGLNDTRINGQEEVVFTGGTLLLHDVRALMGKGHDYLELSDLAVAGHVRIGVGQVDTVLDAGSDEILLDNVLVGGDLAINAGGGADLVELDEVGVLGITELRGGGGNDQIFINDSALAELLLDAGNGRDDVALEDTIVALEADVRLGNGNDVLAILGESAIPAGSILNGNSGRDRLIEDEEAVLIDFTILISLEVQEVVV